MKSKHVLTLCLGLLYSSTLLSAQHILYSHIELAAISNAVWDPATTGGGIAFVAATEGQANFPGYPDPNSLFFRLTLVRENQSGFPLETDPVASQQIELATVNGGSALGITYRNPEGFQYAFTGRYRVLDGSNIEEDTIFQLSNWGITPNLAEGTDGVLRGCSFSAAGYFLLYHQKVNGQWKTDYLIGPNQPFGNPHMVLDEDNNAHIAAVHSQTNELYWFEVDAAGTMVNSEFVDAGVSAVCGVAWENGLHILCVRDGEVLLLSHDAAAATWEEDLVYTLSADETIENRGDLLLQGSSPVVALHTSAGLKMLEKDAVGDWKITYEHTVSPNPLNARAVSLLWDAEAEAPVVVYCDSVNVYTNRSTVSAAPAIAEAVGLTVSPNPAGSYFLLDFQTEASLRCEVEILDAQGRLLDRFPVEGRQALVSTEGWEAGCYFVQTTGGRALKVVVNGH